MSLESIFTETLSKKTSHKSDYDCLVLFSGGKDSTYLAHLIKQVKAERVCLFNVDNCFEDDIQPKIVAEKLNLDLITFKPKEEEIIKFYNFILSDQVIKEIDTNPLCYICNRYFTSLGVCFAQKFDIPFVITGTTATQVFGSKVIMSERLINIAEELLKARFEKTYNTIKVSERYKQDAVIKRVIDKTFVFPDEVIVLRPFLYFGYNVEKIKRELENNYDWKNPTPGVTNEDYTTSGCKLTEIFGVFKRKLGFEFHELNEFRLDYENGSLNQEEFLHATTYFENMISKELTCEMKCMINKLGLNDQLL